LLCPQSAGCRGDRPRDHRALNKIAGQTLYKVEAVGETATKPEVGDARMGDEPLTKAEWIRSALERYERPLIRYAARITGNVELARDVVQDAFLRLCEAEQTKVDGHVAAWLYTVCRNRAFDVRKTEARMDPLQDEQLDWLHSGGAEPGALAARNEAYTLALDALSTLPENQQEAIRLKFQDEMTYREISQVMGVSLGTVSHLITAALGSLHEQLRGNMDLAQEV
jgi:RNA polymerase sigma factor (sigma-70 family)